MLNIGATAFTHLDDELRSGDVTTEDSGFIATPTTVKHTSVTLVVFFESLNRDTSVIEKEKEL